jgi:3-deoxy-D-manno-octulosonic-acid transferase
LDTRGLAWVYRSRLIDPPGAGTVILWDTFGELSALYERAQAVFVGGSLEPLGGQNFLEPLTCGVIPVIGPHWDNFKWVGRELFGLGLVRQVENGAAVAEQLVHDLQRPDDRHAVTTAAMGYIQRNQGGTRRGCRLIEEYLHASR